MAKVKVKYVRRKYMRCVLEKKRYSFEYGKVYDLPECKRLSLFIDRGYFEVLPQTVKKEPKKEKAS